MKRILFLALAISVGFAACNAIDEWTKFDIDYDTSFTIPATSTLGLPINLNDQSVETNIEQEIEAQDSRKDLIEDVRLKTVRFTITAPAGEDFSFLESVALYISADGLPELKIAENNNVDAAPGSPLELTPIDVDLSEYIKKDAFSLRANIVADETTTQDINVTAYILFGVDAKILGI